MSCTDIAKYFPHFQICRGTVLCCSPADLGHFVPKLRNGASAPGRRQPGLGRLPNKHFGKHFCRRPGTKILSVFTLELLAKNASVATLALLAVSEIPIRSLACLMERNYNICSPRN